MALFPKTPGVYVQEISTLPPSVAPVPTAIPVFIGYTQKAIINGSQWDYGTKGATDPIRVESLLDFTTIFGGAYTGGPYTDIYEVTLTDAGFSVANNYGDYNLFTNLQMFYANGGGTCYIISVGGYLDTINGTNIINAIDKAEKVDEITMLVVPEATTSDAATLFQDINDAMLDHCAKMQDRFAILEVKHTDPNTIADDADDFRNNGVGINNLSYGAAYYPPLNSTLINPYFDFNVRVFDNRTNPVYIDDSTHTYNNLFSIKNGYAAWARLYPFAATAGATYTINGIQLKEGVDFHRTPMDLAAVSLRDAINNHPILGVLMVGISAGHSSGYIGLIAKNSETDGTLFTIAASVPAMIESSAGANFHGGNGTNVNSALYNSILAELNSDLLVLYPAATMAGVYTAIDNSRGVWKAPANVSVNRVSAPSINITDADQSGLNVDSNAGKSIDAIRTFNGRGTLVWGARTLDGNSNDFRYVNVRRTLIFIEHSCKLASEFVVFEPNDKGTWIRVKGMISNFLNNVWRDGGLVGDKAEQAYFVKVGLGETMTAQDILEGRLIVTIGLAISHPAEFIILNFEHKLQEA